MAATLRSLIANRYGLRVFCSGCRRCADLDVIALVESYGEDMQLPEIGKRSRCAECGTRGGDVQVVAVKAW